MANKVIDPAPIIKELADRCLKAKGLECSVLGSVIDLLKAAPAVDAVEVVHGRWEDGECTACGFDIRDMIDGESEFRSWVWECVPYCPNCGAKMDGDGNA